MKIYVALMENGSDETLIRKITTSPRDALKHLQELFLRWRSSDDLSYIKDLENPTLDEMNVYFTGYASIVELEDGAELDEELRNWSFSNGVFLKSSDERLVTRGKSKAINANIIQFFRERCYVPATEFVRQNPDNEFVKAYPNAIEDDDFINVNDPTSFWSIKNLLDPCGPKFVGLHDVEKK